MKFSKAYEPNQYEPDIYALWEKSGAFAPTNKKDAKNYTIVMPPPNANGNLHIGHGLTIALEDILTRYHRLKGDNTWYIPGADHAGFETWVVYERRLEAEGKTRFDYSRDDLYNQVWDFVHEQRGNMELQLRALGASCDWDSLTFTLDQKVVDTVYNTFEKLWKQGLIYRGVKLVNFCTKHQTAFADIEVTHKDEKGKLWSIAYPLVTPKDGIEEVVVSTTRPKL
jgi:valyl-tRNA synthetase